MNPPIGLDDFLLFVVLLGVIFWGAVLLLLWGDE